MRRNTGYRGLLLIFIMLQPFFSRAGDPDSANNNTRHKISFGVYPAAGYKPETSFLLGLVGIAVFNQKKQDDSQFIRPTTITPYFFYTFRKQFLSYLNMEMYPQNRFYFRGTFRYWNYPDQYYGIGNKTSGISEEYKDRIFKYEAKLSRIINKKILAGLAFQWQNNHLSNIRNNGFLDTTAVVGKGGGNVLGIGPHFRYDSRDNTLYTTKGYFLESYIIFNPPWGINDYHFNMFALDFRAYTRVFTTENILALQIYYNSVWGGNVPFYMLPKLGGDQRLRGIEHENRYTDRQAYYIQAEGRRHLFGRFGGVIFTGIGDVNNSLGNFSFRSLKFVIGIGGRFQPLKDEKLNLRLDAGKGPDKQYAIYFSLNEAF